MNMLRTLIRRTLARYGYTIHRTSSPPYGVSHLDDIRRYAPRDVKLVFDIGANIGQTAITYRAAFPQAHVFAFEPVSATFQELQSRTSDDPQISCHQLAFGEAPGTAELHRKEVNRHNSLNPRLNQGTGGTETIEIDTVDAFVERHGIEEIDLIKTDTENFDIQVMKGASETLSSGKVSFVFAEVTLDQEDYFHTHFGTLSDNLRDNGFEFMAFYDRLYNEGTPSVRSWSNALFIRRSLLPNWYSPEVKKRFIV